MLTLCLKIVIVSSFLCMIATGQTQQAKPSTPETPAIDAFIQELLTASAEANGQQAAKVQVLTSAERNAKQELEKISEAKTKAQREVNSSRREMEIAKVAANVTNSACETCAVQLKIYEKYEGRVEAFEVATATLTDLEGKEELARDKLAKIQSDKQEARSLLTEMETRQQQDSAQLRSLYNAWKANQTEQAYVSLTGHLTQMSAQYNNKYDVTFVTQGIDNQWTAGARINYETALQRKNNTTPTAATNCTTQLPAAPPACVKAGMPKGWYYIWSVREGRATSSKEYYTEIGAATTVTIKEDQP